MSKIFKFDAIGRDLLPGERQAAREFVSKYASPPSKADVHKQMRTVVGRVLRAAAQVNGQVDDAVPSKSRGVKARSTTPAVVKASAKRSAKG